MNPLITDFEVIEEDLVFGRANGGFLETRVAHVNDESVGINSPPILRWFALPLKFASARLQSYSDRPLGYGVKLELALDFVTDHDQCEHL